MKAAVITGATGMIGSSLASLLLSEGYEVHAVVRPASSRLDDLSCAEELYVHEVDVTELGSLTSRIPHPCSLFFHLAWSGSTGIQRNDPLAQYPNIAHTMKAVEVAHALGCEAFVGAGSQAEYGRHEAPLRPDTPTYPESAYGQAKLCAGQLSRMYAERLGIRHEWARIVSVYGPGDGPNTLVSYVIRTLLQGGKPLLTACGQTWDYLYVDDAARALLGMAEHGKNGETYVVGSGVARPLASYVETLRSKIDETASLGFGEVPYAESQIMHLCSDIEHMERDFGFKPRVNFEEGSEHTILWMQGKMGDCA